MEILKYVSTLIIPIIFFSIISYGLLKSGDIYSSFIEGAKEGINVIISILPSLIGLVVAINMLKASGAIDLLANGLAPVFKFIKLPVEVLPLILLRPVSGSASLTIVNDVFKTMGPDSYAGRLVSVMMGSTETTFYTIAVYFAATGIKDIRHTLKAALLADLIGIIASIIVVSIFF